MAFFIKYIYTTQIIMQMFIDKFQIHNLQLKRDNFVQKSGDHF